MLTDRMIATIKEAAKNLKGSIKRAFMAGVANDYLGGSARNSESVFGWDRVAVNKGQMEIKTGIICIDNHAAKGRRKTENILLYLEDDIRDLLDRDSQVDPKFRSPFRYSRVSANSVRKALMTEYAYTDKELPCVQTMGDILNRLDYSLKKTLKTTPLKKYRRQIPYLTMFTRAMMKQISR